MEREPPSTGCRMTTYLPPLGPLRPVRHDPAALYEKLTIAGQDNPPACEGDDTFIAERADLRSCRPQAHAIRLRPLPPAQPLPRLRHRIQTQSRLLGRSPLRERNRRMSSSSREERVRCRRPRNVRPPVALTRVTHVRQQAIDRPVDGRPLRVRVRTYGMVTNRHRRETKATVSDETFQPLSRVRGPHLIPEVSPAALHRSGLCAREARTHAGTADGRAL